MALSSANTENNPDITNTSTQSPGSTSPTFTNNPAFYQSSYSTDGLCRDNNSITSSGRKSSVRDFLVGGVFSKSTPTTPSTELFE